MSNPNELQPNPDHDDIEACNALADELMEVGQQIDGVEGIRLQMEAWQFRGFIDIHLYTDEEWERSEQRSAGKQKSIGEMVAEAFGGALEDDDGS